MTTSKALGCLIALGFGVAIGTSDPVIMEEAVCLILAACSALYITEGY